MRITVIGTGYVGLVSGVCLAAQGHTVTCVDKNEQIVTRLNEGSPHIHEKGLPELLKQVRASGRFVATMNLQEALQTAEGALIAVGTPSENGIIDLTFVRTVAAEIGAYIRTTQTFLPIVVKSTVIPGTTDSVVRQEIEKTSGKPSTAFGLGMNPEFLREGEAVSDFMHPDRIVLGFEDQRTKEFLAKLYAPWTCDKLYVNTRTAELIKYANNALLATQISAINEIANLAATLGGIDIMDVVRGVHLDKRWNPISTDGRRINPSILTYLVPGCGFGGSCFPKDVQALRSQGQSVGLRMSMLDSVLQVNDQQAGQVRAGLKHEFGTLAGRHALVLGLAFKPETDDVRESASLKIIMDLLAERSVIVAHDPIAAPNFRQAFGPSSSEVTFVDDWRSHVAKADYIVVATRWEEYKELISHDLQGKVVFDARRFYEPDVLKGARYLSIGRRVA